MLYDLARKIREEHAARGVFLTPGKARVTAAQEITAGLEDPMQEAVNMWRDEYTRRTATGHEYNRKDLEHAYFQLEPSHCTLLESFRRAARLWTYKNETVQTNGVLDSLRQRWGSAAVDRRKDWIEEILWKAVDDVRTEASSTDRKRHDYLRTAYHPRVKRRI